MIPASAVFGQNGGYRHKTPPPTLRIRVPVGWVERSDTHHLFAQRVRDKPLRYSPSETCADRGAKRWVSTQNVSTHPTSESRRMGGAKRYPSFPKALCLRRRRSFLQFHPLSIVATVGLLTSAPVRRIQASLDKFSKRRKRPIRRTRCVTVLDRIEMNVIAVRCKIPLVTNRVFPIPALPDAALVFGRTAR